VVVPGTTSGLDTTDPRILFSLPVCKTFRDVEVLLPMAWEAYRPLLAPPPSNECAPARHGNNYIAREQPRPLFCFEGIDSRHRTRSLAQSSNFKTTLEGGEGAFWTTVPKSKPEILNQSTSSVRFRIEAYIRRKLEASKNTCTAAPNNSNTLGRRSKGRLPNAGGWRTNSEGERRSGRGGAWRRTTTARGNR